MPVISRDKDNVFIDIVAWEGNDSMFVLIFGNGVCMRI